MFCFTFVSKHHTDSLMLYSVQLKNTYSYLSSSLKLSDTVRGHSCQQLYCNWLSLYKFISIIPFILFYKFLLFPSTTCADRGIFVMGGGGVQVNLKYFFIPKLILQKAISRGVVQLLIPYRNPHN